MTSIHCVDTPAALKLLIGEKESAPLADWLTASATDGDSLCFSFLLHTELHCAARRRSKLKLEAVASLLSGFELIDISRSHLIDAARSSMRLRAADATAPATLRCRMPQNTAIYSPLPLLRAWRQRSPLFSHQIRRAGQVANSDDQGEDHHSRHAMHSADQCVPELGDCHRDEDE